MVISWYEMTNPVVQMVISWYETTNPMVRNDWYEMVMVRNVHNSNNLHGLVLSQFYGRISAERINGGSYFRLSNKFDGIDRGLFLKYLTF